MSNITREEDYAAAFERLKHEKLKEEVKRLTNSVDAKYDSGKLHLSYVPSALIYAVAYIREYGNAKYHDPNNWLDVEWQRYYEALLRHVELFKADPKGYDDESGLPHLWHIACNVAFLCHMLEPMYCEKLGIKIGEQLDFRKISPYFENLDKECNADV